MTFYTVRPPRTPEALDEIFCSSCVAERFGNMPRQQRPLIVLLLQVDRRPVVCAGCGAKSDA